MVRSIGSDLRMDYTVVGQTTHLAARMEQLAVPGTIRLTADTLRRAEGLVEVNSLGPIPIKGLPNPVAVFELVGAGAARTRLKAAARRGLTRFVGRSVELAQLQDALDRATLGRGQVVAVVGDPGVGKSHLFREFIHSHRLQGYLVLETTSVSYGKAASYLPVIDLLKRYFKIQDRDEVREIREKVTGKLLTLDRALEPTLSPLLALLDVPVDDTQWKTLESGQRRQRTLEALRQLLLREAREQPLLLIFEDLHWIDGETQTLLDNLVESLPAARLLLLLNYRPEYSHGWGSKTYYRQLRIDPLPPESADELLDALLGFEAAFAPLKRLLIERTDANPLFLEESVRSFIATGALEGGRGAYRLTRPIEQLTMPATVRAILAAQSTASPHRPNGCFRPPRLSARTCPRRCYSPSPTRRSRRSAPSSLTCRPRNSSTRSSCFRTSSTRSSTRLRMRWSTRACSRTDVANCTPRLSMPSRHCTGIGSPRRSSVSPTMPSTARFGRKLCALLARSDKERRHAPRIGRQSLPSTKLFSR